MRSGRNLDAVKRNTDIMLRDEYEEFVDSDSHAQLGRPFRVKARLYNNRLVRAREDLNLSVVEVSKKFGLSVHTIYNYENLKNSPWSTTSRDWRSSAKKLAEAYGYSPEELWPDVIRDVERRYIETEISSAPPALAPAPEEIVDQEELRASVRDALLQLPPRQEQIIRRFYGIDCEPESVESIADRYSVTRTRIFELKKKALHKIGSAKSRKVLELFYPDGVKPKSVGVDPFERAKDSAVADELAVRSKSPSTNFEDGEVAVWCTHLDERTFWTANWVRLSDGAYFIRKERVVLVHWYVDCDNCRERRWADGKHQPTMKGGAALYNGKGLKKVGD